jgi:hypothetical protein
MNRRKFCLATVAAAIAGRAAGQTACAAPAASTPAESILAAATARGVYKIIYDRRFAAGRAFGAAAQKVRTTAGIVAIDADITALWSHDLRRQWSTGGGAIAGMTTARTLFCLEQLAKDHWMRVVNRAEHAISGSDDNLVAFVIA